MQGANQNPRRPDDWVRKVERHMRECEAARSANRVAVGPWIVEVNALGQLVARNVNGGEPTVVASP